MNERIKLLAEQASTFAFTEYPKQTMATFNTNKSVNQLFNQKFAQLIVAECIECADTVGKNNLASGYPNSTAHHVKQKIKQHFGVEP